MFKVRPVRSHDISALLVLAQEAGPGMTTLMSDQAALEATVNDAELCFAQPDVMKAHLRQSDVSHGASTPSGRDSGHTFRRNARFLWVLEDTDTGSIVGCAAVKPSVGGDAPFYSMMRQHQRVHSATAGITREDAWLISGAHFPVATELGTLYLQKAYRQKNLAELLSYTRLLFIANFPDYFHSLLIAEVRGVQEADGSSPFWDALGRHFFHMTFAEADSLCWQQGTDFIAELMPKVPILQALLPVSAQRVISQAHHESHGALTLLQHQGLALSPYIDLFDGGPLIWADRAHVSVIKSAIHAQVVIGELKLHKPCWLVRHATLHGATMLVAGELAHQHSHAVLTMDAATAATLGVDTGAKVMVYAVGDVEV
jgi:arginine N-succinyltransferase